MSVRFIALLIAALTCTVDASAAPDGCAAALLKGRYVFAGQGIIEPLEPGIQRLHYGTLLFDGQGRLSGKQSSSRGGKIGRETLEGGYTLDADCSGTMAFSFAGRPGTITHWDFYLTEDGRLGHMLRMDEGTMAVRTFQK